MVAQAVSPASPTLDDFCHGLLDPLESGCAARIGRPTSHALREMREENGASRRNTMLSHVRHDFNAETRPLRRYREVPSEQRRPRGRLEREVILFHVKQNRRMNKRSHFWAFHDVSLGTAKAEGPPHRNRVPESNFPSRCRESGTSAPRRKAWAGNVRSPALLARMP
jgi:hypothetical protein